MSIDTESPQPSHNAEAALPEMIEQIRALDAEIADLKDKQADLWAAAKDAGLDVKAMKGVIKEMDDPEKLAANIAGEMVRDRYRRILKLIEAGIDPHTAKVRAVAAHLQGLGVNVTAGV